jgi:hypothetical protein
MHYNLQLQHDHNMEYGGILLNRSTKFTRILICTMFDFRLVLKDLNKKRYKGKKNKVDT